MSKRGAEEAELEDEGANRSPDSMLAAAGSPAGANNASLGNSAGGGHSSGKQGARIFHPNKPLKLQNKHKHVYTKSFFFKIYANDWMRFATPTNDGMDIVGFMTNIPYQALCMYISPSEYLELIRNSSYSKILHADFELEFKAVRTPFDANSIDQSEANGNLQFELKRWDGLEQMMPFTTVDLEGAEPTTFTKVNSYSELITRLYGVSLQQGPVANTTWPATMRERGLSWRPLWNFSNTAANTSGGTMYLNLNTITSSLPINEFATEQINTNVAKMGEGYCFCKSYKPKNGIITMASSIYNTNNVTRWPARTQVNNKIRYRDNLPTGPGPILNNSPQYIAVYPITTQNTYLTGQIETTNAATSNSAATITNINPQMQSLEFQAVGSCGADSSRYAATTGCIPNSTPSVHFSDFGGQTQAVWNSAGNIEQISVVTGNNYTPINSITSPTPTNAIATIQNDNLWYGYNQELAAYSVRSLENYDAFTSRNEPPIHHMPSMLIGAIPKTNKDNSIVKATFEFEVKTRIVVESQHVHPTYTNIAYNAVAEPTIPVGYIDPVISALPDNTNTLFRTRFQHNEHDVLLGDNLKYWSGSYGLAAKPTFDFLPGTTPMLYKKEKN